MWRALLLLTLLPALAPNTAGEDAQLSGREIMERVYARHRQYPFVYEEQSLILIDHRDQRETRKLRRYSRAEPDGVVRFLLLFEAPSEVEGVALLAERSPDGGVKQSLYLPAFGGSFATSTGCEITCGGNFLGTDFSVENLTGERLDDYSYLRQPDFRQDELDYYVIAVFSADGERGPFKRHFVRQDNLYLLRTDYLDDLGRVHKRQTQHDLARVHGDMWRANMLLMENMRDNHRTVIKIDKRVFSADYVPEEVFTRDWLRSRYPPPQAAEPALDPELANAEGDS